MKSALIGTGSINLIKATFDRYWGSGLPLNTKGMTEGRWSGSNVLGHSLELGRETSHGKETNIANSQPANHVHQSADLAAGTSAPDHFRPPAQPQIQSQVLSQSHVPLSQQPVYKPAGGVPYQSGSQAGCINVIRPKSPIRGNLSQAQPRYMQAPPSSQFGQYALPNPWPALPSYLCSKSIGSNANALSPTCTAICPWASTHPVLTRI